MVRFLADASLHHAIVTGCARREPAIDFLSAQSAKLDGMSDPDVLGSPPPRAAFSSPTTFGPCRNTSLSFSRREVRVPACSS